ncbi:hypothetical protein GCM10011514_42340 [Emticicia aquatilis]|uniref:Collagen-like protein n=1 Tax=Emticicia aquatilis TaxID=1537369 RepID=A0A916Z471_9BACT|nr:hypothetical protein GCM10011514_42340 [Emticicia aquatilis]
MIHAQNARVNAVEPSAALDVASTSKGMLVPRMNETQKTAISSPANGLLIYQTDGVAGFHYYNGTSWILLGAVGPQGPQGAVGPQGPQGAVGPQGPQGAVGPQGPQGAVGLQGPQGAVGPQGPQGATGPQGPQGATGPQGPAGSSGIYGDGSAGALTISSNTDWSSSPPTSSLQYSSFTVNSGAIFAVPSGTIIRCTGNVIINGTIIVGTGATNSNVSPHPGISLSAPGSVIGGVGLGVLQAALIQTSTSLVGGGAGYRNVLNTGGEGGGQLRIVALGSITIGTTGVINANGNNSVNSQTALQGIVGGGGGAGGVVVLASNTSITISGNINAKGGNGADGFDGNGGSAEGGGGGGGGGIARLIAPASPTVTGTINVNGGSAGITSGNTASGLTGGGGGGACGGNGGQASGTIFSVSYTATAGSVGKSVTTVTSTPANLFF